MEDKKFLTEEEKHKKAYNELKEIQRKYGFENIAQLREFYRDLSQTFLDYDRPKESMRGEEFEPLFKEIFKFVSDIDTMDEEEMDIAYVNLKNLLYAEKLSPKIIGFVDSVYKSRKESDIEILRRKIVKEGLEIVKTLTDHYTKKYADYYRKVMIYVMDFAFDFPTEYSDWNNPNLCKQIHWYKHQFRDIANIMNKAKVPEEIIQHFLKYSELVPEYKLKIREAGEKRRQERQNRLN